MTPGPSAVPPLAQALASLPEGALRALAHGFRAGILAVDSSPESLAARLHLSPESAAALRAALVASTADPAAIAFGADCTLAGRPAAAEATLPNLVELVLSGPAVDGVPMRDTAVVFESLMREAREEVLVTSYVAGFASDLLEPLARFLRAEPGRRATMVLNFQRNHDTTIESDLVARLANDFWKRQWPGGEPRPTLWYDPRGIAKDQGSRASMHAKVVVIDRRKAFITSANLTARAQDKNIELGVLIQHPAIARRIVEYFDALIARGLLVRA